MWSQIAASLMRAIGGMFVIARGSAPVLLDRVEEPLDQIARPVETGTETDGLLAVLLQGMLAQAPYRLTSALIQPVFVAMVRQ